jgi:hypothetical protein
MALRIGTHLWSIQEELKLYIELSSKYPDTSIQNINECNISKLLESHKASTTNVSLEKENRLREKLRDRKNVEDCISIQIDNQHPIPKVSTWKRWNRFNDFMKMGVSCNQEMLKIKSTLSMKIKVVRIPTKQLHYKATYEDILYTKTKKNTYIALYHCIMR